MSRFVPGQKELDRVLDITEDELRDKTFGQLPDEPLLGQYTSLPTPPVRQDKIELNITLPMVCTLILHHIMASSRQVNQI